MQIAFLDIGNSSAKCYIVNQGIPNKILEDFIIRIEKDHLLSWVKEADHNTMFWYIASVVPALDKSLSDYLGLRSRFIRDSDVKGIDLNLMSKPQEIGIDRILCSLAVFKKTQATSLVISGGTAITFNVVNKLGEFEGGLILPGLELAKLSLQKNTAKLPAVHTLFGYSLTAKETTEAISSGIYFGYIEMINGLIMNYKKDKFVTNVFATGYGLNPLLESLDLDAYDPCLTLEGLLILAQQDISLRQGD